MSETEHVYEYAYLCALKIIKQQLSSFVNNISDKCLFKAFSISKSVNYPVKNGKIITV